MPIIGSSRRISVEEVTKGGYDPTADALELLRSFECISEAESSDITHDHKIKAVIHSSSASNDELRHERSQRAPSRRTRFSSSALSLNEHKEDLVTHSEKNPCTGVDTDSTATTNVNPIQNLQTSTSQKPEVSLRKRIKNFDFDLHKLAPSNEISKEGQAYTQSSVDRSLEHSESEGGRRSSLRRLTRSSMSIQYLNDPPDISHRLILQPPYVTTKRTRSSQFHLKNMDLYSERSSEKSKSKVGSSQNNNSDALPLAKRLRSSSFSVRSDKEEENALPLANSKRTMSSTRSSSQQSSHDRNQSEPSSDSNFHPEHSKYRYYGTSRRTNKNNNIPVAKIKESGGVGIDREAFELRFKELLKFKQKNGHTLVPKSYPPNQGLAYFVFRMRFYHHNSNQGLPADIEERLNGIGFSWVARDTDQQKIIEANARNVVKSARWDEKFQELLQFKKKYGTTLVPKVFPENPSLSSWLFRQRQSKKKYDSGQPANINKEQIQKLDEVGFVWEPRASSEWRILESTRKQVDKDKNWQKHFSELVKFKEENGHTRVPKVYAKNPSLGSWVYRQRRKYKMMLDESDTNFFTTNRWKQLQKIGFEFKGQYNRTPRSKDDEVVESIITNQIKKSEKTIDLFKKTESR